MDCESLKKIIILHKEKFLDKKNFVKREVQFKIHPFLKQKEIILITGIRRSGKSSLMRLLCGDIMEEFKVAPSNIFYVNFEDERFIDFNYKDFDALHELFLEVENPHGKIYLFLDEVQKVSGWERWVNRLYEFENIKIFISGSNAEILGSEASSALTGRNRQIINYPFSFRELLKLRRFNITEKDLYIKERKILLKNLFKEYLKLGGFPEVLRIKDETLLDQYFKDILYRDVIGRYSIRHNKELRELCVFLASNIGSIYSYKNIQQLISAKNINTVKNYLDILEEVFLFFRVKLFDFSVKRQIYNPSKIYAADHSLGNSIAFRFSENMGHIYENIVFVELMRRNKEIFYWKSYKGNEVDFVLKRGLKIEQAIQVSCSLAAPKTKKREFNALLEAKKELGVNDLYVLTENEERQEKINGVKINVIPLWKWLLAE